MSAEELKYFFSYARRDSEFVLKLAKELRSIGANVWLDQLDILGGEHWDSTVEKAMKSCEGMIAVLSPEAVASVNVMDEVSYALNEAKLIVPILLRSCNIPFRLQRVQYIDFSSDYETGFSQLLKALSIEETAEPSKSTAIREPLLPKDSESTADEHKSAQAGSKSRIVKMLAAICVVTLIIIASIGLFLKYIEPKASEVITNSIGMKLVYIPAGSFMMGSGSSPAQVAREYDPNIIDEFPQHEVRISKGFWISQTEVTQGQYESVMNARPWSGMDLVQESPDNPAVYVNWESAAAFCIVLSQKENKAYRLPTEAEWEYACRAGTTTRFSFGDNRSSLGEYAWFYDNTVNLGKKYPHPVGQKKASPWGLFDMHGNVLEWCSDWYDPNYYSETSNVDPKGPSLDTHRCLRGGSFYTPDNNLSCSNRDWLEPNDRNESIGFRVVHSQ